MYISNDSNNSRRSNSTRSGSICSNSNRETKVEIIGESEEVRKKPIAIASEKHHGKHIDQR